MGLVLADLTNKRRRYKKAQVWVGVGSIVVAGIIAFVPINTFGACSVGVNFIYCGYCFTDLSKGLILAMLLYIIPSLIGIVLFILLCKIKQHLQFLLKSNY